MPSAPDVRGDRDGCIVIVTHNGARFIHAALTSCARHAVGVPVIVVDNGSSDGTPDLVAGSFPDVTLLVQPRNLGYAGGCNAGITAARARAAPWTLLLNQDVVLQTGVVQRLAAFLAANERAAAVQPAVMRPDGLCNSLGNPFHFLGFSFAGGNGKTEAAAVHDPALPWLRDPAWRTSGVEIPAVSGAAVMLRMAALDDAGDFETELFLYHEDFELSLRLRERGWTLHLAGGARVVHDYEFSRNLHKWYYLERNRHWVVLAHYEARTLALLAIPLLAVELAVWAQAVRGGWTGEKLRAYAYWATPEHRAYLRARRRSLRARRRRGDAQILAAAGSRLVLGEGQTGFASAMFDLTGSLAWRAVRPLIR